MHPSNADRGAEPLIVVEITVVRTGGIAGMRREWRAVAEGDDASRLVTLIEGCPWDAVTDSCDPSRSGADRYVWRIDARCGPDERTAELPDSAVEGPWRELVDTVRDGQPPPGA